MGIIISRFRKNPTIKEKLQKLVKDIKDIEEFRLDTQKRQKNIVGRFILFSVFMFISAAVAFYFLYLPERVVDRILYMVPFLFFPFLIVFLKRLITWYYSRKIKRDEVRLEKLKEEKKQLLDEVMDKETYKNAKEILEKFAPEQLQKESAMNINNRQIVKPILSGSGPIVPAMNQDVRRRTMAPPQTAPQQMLSNTPGWKNTPQIQSATPGWKIPPSAPISPFQQRASLPPGPPLPRPVLPKDRGVMDRLVDFIVGDGPGNRYALICRSCAYHNGMALQEEFEYLAFRCCYCFTWNPARKQRPQAPLLPTSAGSQGEEEGESSPSSSDAEGETKNASEEELREKNTETENTAVPENENNGTEDTSQAKNNTPEDELQEVNKLNDSNDTVIPPTEEKIEESSTNSEI